MVDLRRGQFETGLTAKFKPPPLSMLLPKVPLTNELPTMPEQDSCMRVKCSSVSYQIKLDVSRILFDELQNGK